MAQNNAQQPSESHSYAARVVYSEQARMSRTDLDRFRLIAQPVEETPLERFMTMNGAEEANNMYAREQMRGIGIDLGDESTMHSRQQAAQRLAADVLASTESKKEKRKKEQKKSRSSA